MANERFATLLMLILAFQVLSFSQDPLRFRNDIDTIIKRYSARTTGMNLIVFTGSSSIRKWTDLNDYFPGRNIINTGFGGSQMSDLIYFSEQAIFQYSPVQVFIYEGDNDIASGEKPSDIINEADSLIRLIHKRLPGTEIVMISAKPSPLRWALKDDYQKYNEMLKGLSLKYSYVKYLDLWTTLIGPSGRPVSEFYIKDSLHINDIGYSKWAPIVGKALK